jgi:hypothetical protein
MMREGDGEIWKRVKFEFDLKTAVGGKVLREDVAADALRGFANAHLWVRRAKPRSADAVTASARRSDQLRFLG